MVSSAAARRRKVDAETEVETPPAETVEADAEVVEPVPLVKEGDAEFEKLLAEEEAIEASTREHHETPHFRPGDSD